MQFYDWHFLALAEVIIIKIGYEFKNKKLLKCAFTHISYANENHIESNQRLEFLGDSVLSLIIAEKLYALYPNADEGRLTRMRASLVCEKSLAHLASEMELGEDLVFGVSETRSDGVHKASILCDTFEALLGAIFLDGGIETAKNWTLSVFGDRLLDIKDTDMTNYKSELQSYYQKREKKRGLIEYRVKSRSGPDHSPTFTVEVYVCGKKMGIGKGKSTKAAESEAAKQALLKAKQGGKL